MARPGMLNELKFKRLANMIGNIASALGSLELLWAQAYERGDPDIGSAKDIEMTANWQGMPGFLVQALLTAGGEGKAGFIEPTPGRPGRYQVHDLYDHAPEYVKKRMTRELERKQMGLTISEMRSTAGKKGRLAQLDDEEKHDANIVTDAQWDIVVQALGGKCLQCGTTQTIGKNRIVPTSLGGSSGLDNLQPLCKSCNAKKRRNIIDHRPQNWRTIIRDHIIDSRRARGLPPKPLDTKSYISELLGWCAEETDKPPRGQTADTAPKNINDFTSRGQTAANGEHLQKNINDFTSRGQTAANGGTPALKIKIKNKIKNKRKNIVRAGASPRFTPPTIDEVRAYCHSRGNTIDPELFVDKMTSIGWVVGRNRFPIKNWQAAIRTWENHERGRSDTARSDIGHDQRYPLLTPKGGRK